MAELLWQAIRFGERYDREKRRRNTADFSDQEHLAIRLLLDGDGRPTALCRRVAGRYRFQILVKTARSPQSRAFLSETLEEAGRLLPKGVSAFINPYF